MAATSRTLARVETRRPPNGAVPTPIPVPTLVVIPTYEESANIETVVRRVRVALPRADVLVVDDNSPDGTAAIVDALGAELGRISVLRRATKDGLGAAYRA